MTDLVDATLFSCRELLYAIEQAKLDLWNPQVQAGCGELTCNESS